MLLDDKGHPIQDETGRHIEGQGRAPAKVQIHPRPGPQVLNPWRKFSRGGVLIGHKAPAGFTRLRSEKGRLAYRGPQGRYYDIDQMREYVATNGQPPMFTQVGNVFKGPLGQFYSKRQVKALQGKGSVKRAFAKRNRR